MKNIDNIGDKGRGIVNELGKKMTYLKNSRSALLRQEHDKKTPDNKTLGEFVENEYQFDQDINSGMPCDSFFETLGIDIETDTIQSFLSLPDTDGRRWLVPEIIREAVRQSLPTSLWADVTSTEEDVAAKMVVTPSLSMGGAFVGETAEGENLPYGTLKYEDKVVELHKLGSGLNLTYELVQSCSLKLISTYLVDFGNILNHKINSKLLDVLINGDQKDGSLSAGNVGVIDTAKGIQYRDLLKSWIKMGTLGKSPDFCICGEDIAENLLMISEFKDKQAGTPQKIIDMKMPIPEVQNVYPYSMVPDNLAILVNKKSSVVKFNFQNLMVENDKDITKQIYEMAASVITGFGIINRDSRIIVNSAVALGADGAANGYPKWMSAKNFLRGL